MNLVKYTFKIAIVGGLLYLFTRIIMSQWGMDYTSGPDWLFRMTIVSMICFGIISYKATKNGFISFVDGLRIGMMTTFFLAIFISIGTFVFVSAYNPTYTEGLEKSYRDLHYEKMMRRYIGEEWRMDTITPGAIDTVQRGLDLNIKNHTGYMFTQNGQVLISLMYTFFWGIVASFTLAMLAQKDPE